MDRTNDFQNASPSSSPQNEPRVENDYSNRPEIEQPNPSIVVPSIPQEMPVR